VRMKSWIVDSLDEEDVDCRSPSLSRAYLYCKGRGHRGRCRLCLMVDVDPSPSTILSR
jgi:hypothetical protein